MMIGMKRPIYVQTLSDAEREALVAGLRSPDAFVLRRCQILLASSRRKIAREIASDLGCDGQTVRATLARLGACWKRAKDWITSPDPAYARKKGPVTV